MPEPLYITTEKGEKIRILTPSEYDSFVAKIDKDYLRTLFEICFWTGMRYVEVRRLHEHPEWILKERNLVHLPREAQRKVRRKAPERKVPIAPQISGQLSYFFKNQKPPVSKVWNNDLKLWAEKSGIGLIGIVPKMTRASIESWMYAIGMDDIDICSRQGHDKLTSLNHYHSLGFMEAEKIEIRRRLAGWV